MNDIPLNAVLRFSSDTTYDLEIDDDVIVCNLAVNARKPHVLFRIRMDLSEIWLIRKSTYPTINGGECLYLNADMIPMGISDVLNLPKFDRQTIKDRLMERFLKARGRVGKNWRIGLTLYDPFFNTKVGMDYMTSVAQAVSDRTRGNVDRIERVVVALEEIAGIEEVLVV